MKVRLNKKNSVMLGIIIVFIALIILVNTDRDNDNEPPQQAISKNISSLVVGESVNGKNYIDAVGSVKADSKISIVALQSATVRNINFNIGDSVVAGQRLVDLSENSILTNLLTAQSDYSNRQNSLEIVKMSTEQDIKSAEINLANAAEALNLAQIQLKSAQDNFDNGLILIEKNKIDLKNNSIITYNNNLSTIFDVLNQIDYIIKVDGDKQIPGIENVIAAKNKQSLDTTKRSYIEAKNCYNNLLADIPSTDEALKSTSNSIECLQATKKALDDVIIVLENTISSVDFSEATLNAQISKFNQLRISILNTEANTKSLQQSIENIEINSKAEKDRLENALALAKNQVETVKINFKNAELLLEKTKSAKAQQIISAEIAKNGALGQLNLANQRAGDLNIKSPINGIVTKKSVEIGEEVSPGKVLAEISQLNLIKIIINLPSEEAYSVTIGDEVLIEDNFKGFISQINPAADSLSKKVEIEIAYENKDGDLIAETFVNVKIPIKENIKSKNGFFLVPLKAVSISQNENYVFIVENNIATKRDVEIGEIQNDLIEIKSGINEKDILVTDGNKNLNEGDKVEIK